MPHNYNCKNQQEKSGGKQKKNLILFMYYVYVCVFLLTFKKEQVSN